MIHASSSRGKVAESVFTGKTIPNGGWNRVGLTPWVDYGLDENQQAAAAARAESASAGEESTATAAVKTVADVSGFYTVKKGCKGGAVRRLQTWLSDLGYNLGAYGVDGDFGSATDAATRTFQTAAGLAVDGVAGRATWAALAKARATAETTTESTAESAVAMEAQG